MNAARTWPLRDLAFSFLDEQLHHQPAAHAGSLARRLSRPNLGVQWVCLDRGEHIHRNAELLSLMRAAGCIGVESASKAANPIRLPHQQEPGPRAESAGHRRPEVRGDRASVHLYGIQPRRIDRRLLPAEGDARRGAAGPALAQLFFTGCPFPSTSANSRRPTRRPSSLPKSAEKQSGRARRRRRPVSPPDSTPSPTRCSMTCPSGRWMGPCHGIISRFSCLAPRAALYARVLRSRSRAGRETAAGCSRDAPYCKFWTPRANDRGTLPHDPPRSLALSQDIAPNRSYPPTRRARRLPTRPEKSAAVAVGHAPPQHAHGRPADRHSAGRTSRTVSLRRWRAALEVWPRPCPSRCPRTTALVRG